MNPTISEWLDLIVRWFHVVVGVLWIGQTAFFSWLDSRLHVERDSEGREKVWMVHSGGFYLVEKQRVPQLMPQTLHWFRWGAALSWISGMLLLIVVYYMGEALVDAGSGISDGLATVAGFGALVVGWVVYDSMWNSALCRNETVGGALSFGLLMVVAFVLTQILSGQAAYIHVGALLGTLMAANVWLRILPGQRQTITAIEEGWTADASLAVRAKQRARHNAFMAVPLIFIMISNHYPSLSGGEPWNWLLLCGLILVGLMVWKLIDLRNTRSRLGNRPEGRR